MKFRMLSREEMVLFDDDFKHYLITNGVSNEEWLEMNKTKLLEAEKLVAIFSDIIFQKAYEKMKFLEHRSKNQLLVFSCEKDEIHLIGLTSTNENVDFSTPEKIHDSILNHSEKIQSFQQTKKYNKEREIELFEMSEQGCVASTAVFWEQLTQLIKG